jgi:hypothetical protein
VMENLFGLDRVLTPKERASLGPKRKDPRPQGHVMPPGSGPKGETCKSCEHIFRNRMSKTYLKCGLNQAYWTGGPKSDIRAGDAACSKWEANKT